ALRRPAAAGLVARGRLAAGARHPGPLLLAAGPRSHRLHRLAYEAEERLATDTTDERKICPRQPRLRRIAPPTTKQILFNLWNLWLKRASIARLQLGEQAQDLEVEPHQGDQQAEGAVPLHVLRRAVLHALLAEVEVQHQVQRRDHDRDGGEADA